MRVTNKKKNQKELWIILQDLSKAYDRTDILILHLALQRVNTAQNH